MKRIAVPLMCSALALLAAQAHAGTSVNLTLGTTGVGVEWDHPLRERLHLRAAVSYGKISREEESDDIEYDAEITVGGAALLLDWHPFANGFRLTTGLAATALKVSLDADAEGEYEIGSRVYTGNPHLDADVEYAPLAPYFGIGWGRAFDSSGLSVTFELGVLLLGDPRVSLDASGRVSTPGINGGNPVDVAHSAEFQEDLERERRKLEEDIDDISFYPVLNLGISYAF